MRIGRLITYVAIAALAGGLGFAAGGGDVDLEDAPEQLAARARDAAKGLHALDEQEAPVTDALNTLRDRVAEGARRLRGYLHETDAPGGLDR